MVTLFSAKAPDICNMMKICHSFFFFFFFLNAPKQEGGVSKSSRSRTREEQFFVSFYESGVET